MPTTIPITSESEWLAMRAKDITSTEISALFGLSPYKTAFELYHEKREGRVVQIEENTRMKWGRRLESPIAFGVAEDEGWEIEKLDVYMRDEAARIGSSFDFTIKSSSDGPGILEIKNVDGLQYRNKWLEDEAPEHIELQIQHQMTVSGFKWCALVALVNGNDPKIIYRDYDPDIGKAIAAKANAFWNMVENGTAPSPDYARDAEVISRLYAQTRTGECFDASNDENIASLVQQYHAIGQEISELERRKDAAKARLLEQIGGAEKVIGPWGSISCGMTSGTAPTLITPEMVGQTYGGRKGFRQFRVNLKKGEAA